MGHRYGGGGAGLVGGAQGILAGTRIAMAIGWRAVEALRPGDRVLTFGAGVRPLRSVRTVEVASDLRAAQWPVIVPAGALGNRDEMALLATQRILIETDRAEIRHGDPFVLIPAAALEGWRGITRRPPQQAAQVLELGFGSDQIVYAGGAMLLVCHARPGAGCAGAIAGRGAPVLSLAQAEPLVACLMAEELGLALQARAQRNRGARA